MEGAGDLGLQFSKLISIFGWAIEVEKSHFGCKALHEHLLEFSPLSNCRFQRGTKRLELCCRLRQLLFKGAQGKSRDQASSANCGLPLLVLDLMRGTAKRDQQ